MPNNFNISHIIEFVEFIKKLLVGNDEIELELRDIEYQSKFKNKYCKAVELYIKNKSYAFILVCFDKRNDDVVLVNQHESTLIFKNKSYKTFHISQFIQWAINCSDDGVIGKEVKKSEEPPVTTECNICYELRPLIKCKYCVLEMCESCKESCTKECPYCRRNDTEDEDSDYDDVYRQVSEYIDEH